MAAPGAVVITVGPNKIRRNQIDHLVEQMAKANPSPEAMGENEKAAMARMIATNLIGQELLELESKALAITAGEKEIDSMYKALRSNFPDEAAWKRALKEGGNTEKTFREKLARQIKADKILNSKVPQVERPTYKEIIDYHAAHKARFPVNDSLRACQVLLIAAKGAPADEVAKKKAELEKLRAELVADSLDVEKVVARFVLAARRHSQGPEAKDGGDLQRFHPNDFNPEFKKQVGRLRVGQISPVFRTPLGWHLVLLTEKFDGKPDSYRLIISRAIAQEKAMAAGKSLRRYLQGLAGKYKVNYLEQALRDTSPTGVYNL
jgi:peptidyl-prolyl cis-trans isomerase SurA